jgi:hypothetical protein
MTNISELGFIEWVKTKPADEKYEYMDLWECAFGQYIRANAASYVQYNISGFGYSVDGQWYEFSNRLRDCLNQCGWTNYDNRTFGSLLRYYEEFPNGWTHKQNELASQ